MGRLRERAKRVRTKGSGWAASNSGLSGEKCETSECSVFFFLSYLPPLQAGNDLCRVFSPNTFFSLFFLLCIIWV
jgi:hypothetical protein